MAKFITFALATFLMSACSSGGLWEKEISLFLKASEDSNELYTINRTYERVGFPRIQLVSVLHIAESAYYERLQSVLTASDLVLYEALDDPKAKAEFKAAGGACKDVSSDLTKIIGFSRMADAFGLSLQTLSIDYIKPNMQLADLTMSQQMLMEAASFIRNPMISISKEERSQIQVWIDSENIQGACSYIKWKSEFSEGKVPPIPPEIGVKDYIELTINLTAFLFSNVEPPFCEVGSMERNSILLDKLDFYIATMKSDQTISVFYGPAHMPCFENHLLTKGYLMSSVETKEIAASNGNKDVTSTQLGLSGAIGAP